MSQIILFINCLILSFTPCIIWIWGYIKEGNNMFSKTEIFMMGGFGALTSILFFLIIFYYPK